MSRDMSIYDKYYKKGGTYELPIELFNDLIDEIDSLRKENKRLTSLCVGHEKELRTKDIIIKQIRMEADDYKSRCKKVIKYIKKLDDDYTDYDGEIVIGDISDTAKRDLLSILNRK